MACTLLYRLHRQESYFSTAAGGELGADDRKFLNLASSKLYERWTGAQASHCLPKPSSASKVYRSEFAVRMVNERAGPPTTILLESLQNHAAVALGRSNESKKGSANADAAKGRKASSRDTAIEPLDGAFHLSPAPPPLQEPFKDISNIASIQVPLPIDLPLREALEVFERAYFEQLLVRGICSTARLAAKSGMERSHLYRKLKSLGITIGKR